MNHNARSYPLFPLEHLFLFTIFHLWLRWRLCTLVHTHIRLTYTFFKCYRAARSRCVYIVSIARGNVLANETEKWPQKSYRMWTWASFSEVKSGFPMTEKKCVHTVVFCVTIRRKLLSAQRSGTSDGIFFWSIRKHPRSLAWKTKTAVNRRCRQEETR